MDTFIVPFITRNSSPGEYLCAILSCLVLIFGARSVNAQTGAPPAAALQYTATGVQATNNSNVEVQVQVTYRNRSNISVGEYKEILGPGQSHFFPAPGRLNVDSFASVWTMWPPSHAPSVNVPSSLPTHPSLTTSLPPSGGPSPYVRATVFLIALGLIGIMVLIAGPRFLKSIRRDTVPLTKFNNLSNQYENDVHVGRSPAVISNANSETRQSLPKAAGRSHSGERTNVSDAQIMLDRAASLVNAANFSEGEQLFRRMIESYPSDPEGYYGVGFVRFRLGDLPTSLASFHKCLEYNPRHSNALYYLGEIAAKQGDEKQAHDRYKQVLEIDPNHKRARERLGLPIEQSQTTNHSVPSPNEASTNSKTNRDSRNVQLGVYGLIQNDPSPLARQAIGLIDSIRLIDVRPRISAAVGKLVRIILIGAIILGIESLILMNTGAGIAERGRQNLLSLTIIVSKRELKAVLSIGWSLRMKHAQLPDRMHTEAARDS